MSTTSAGQTLAQVANNFIRDIRVLAAGQKIYFVGTPAEYARHFEHDVQRWGAIVRASGAQAE